MRLAVFTFDDGRKIGLLPTKVCVLELSDPGEPDVPMRTGVVEDGEDAPLMIQGTFEEAILEVNRALVETGPSFQTCATPGCSDPIMPGQSWCEDCCNSREHEALHRDSSRHAIVPDEKTGKCVDCGEPVWDHQMRCAVCYRAEMDKPVDGGTYKEPLDE